MSLKKVQFVIIVILFSLIGSTLEGVNIKYRAHVADKGWLGWVHDGATAGTTGESRQMEAIQIVLKNAPAGMRVQYRAHVADKGWLPWVFDCATAGTTGESRRMEAVQIVLENAPAGMRIQYRAHVADKGWLAWVYDGEIAGTTGESRRMEAVEIKLVTTRRPGRQTCSTPPYYPTYWNNNYAIRLNNNCYNYSNNKRTDTFAQPGRGGGRQYSSIGCNDVSNAALRDGLTRYTLTAPTYGRTIIALVIWPGMDYHWYRKDNNGYWTHKPGGTNATNLDSSGRLITNPETANRGPYTVFCGYFLTCSDSIQGQGHANIR